MNKITILVPVYNEKNSLLEIIKRIEEVDFGLEKEIILIQLMVQKNYILNYHIKYFIISVIWVKVLLFARGLWLLRGMLLSFRMLIWSIIRKITNLWYILLQQIQPMLFMAQD